ncbi:hypothetical protein [Leptothrix discophora]|uniref:Transcriptional regulator n=1 Tax=Leptothrix discophora TaxID=89 RepID=A0ABT9FZ63_LEPDI|nr:hypothetical protein [Leptothrix discophora]MDP4299533.1 hypothetical protein [Leptothrix discophora]
MHRTGFHDPGDFQRHEAGRDSAMLNCLPTPVQLPPLNLMLDDIGSPSSAALAKCLDVTVRTVERWRFIDKAPRPVELAVYWLTRWGQDAAACEAGNRRDLQQAEISILRNRVDALQAELARVLAAADFGCANDAAASVAPARPLGHVAPARPVLQAVRV